VVVGEFTPTETLCERKLWYSNSRQWAGAAALLLTWRLAQG